ncbi:hypothetical protein [Chryseobacterium taklimakanense]|nr:hypothetical protein [Chryseobacterium taklimakanense]
MKYCIKGKIKRNENPKAEGLKTPKANASITENRNVGMMSLR